MLIFYKVQDMNIFKHLRNSSISELRFDQELGVVRKFDAEATVYGD